jgi:hypothetical protein
MKHHDDTRRKPGLRSKSLFFNKSIFLRLYALNFLFLDDISNTRVISVFFGFIDTPCMRKAPSIQA